MTSENPNAFYRNQTRDIWFVSQECYGGDQILRSLCLNSTTCLVWNWNTQHISRRHENISQCTLVRYKPLTILCNLLEFIFIFGQWTETSNILNNELIFVGSCCIWGMEETLCTQLCRCAECVPVFTCASGIRIDTVASLTSSFLQYQLITGSIPWRNPCNRCRHRIYIWKWVALKPTHSVIQCFIFYCIHPICLHCLWLCDEKYSSKSSGWNLKANICYRVLQIRHIHQLKS